MSSLQVVPQADAEKIVDSILDEVEEILMAEYRDLTLSGSPNAFQRAYRAACTEAKNKILSLCLPSYEPRIIQDPRLEQRLMGLTVSRMFERVLERLEPGA